MDESICDNLYDHCRLENAYFADGVRLASE